MCFSPAPVRALLREDTVRLEGAGARLGSVSYQAVLARGFALGWGVPCLGVTLDEAFAASLPESERDGQALWVAVDTKRGRIALERPDAVPAVFAAADLPRPMGPVLLAGDAAEAAAEALRARGADVRLTALRLPEPEGVAVVAAQCLRGELPPREAEPLYLEPPAVRG